MNPYGPFANEQTFISDGKSCLITNGDQAVYLPRFFIKDVSLSFKANTQSFFSYANKPGETEEILYGQRAEVGLSFLSQGQYYYGNKKDYEILILKNYSTEELLNALAVKMYERPS